MLLYLFLYFFADELVLVLVVLVLKTFFFMFCSEVLVLNIFLCSVAPLLYSCHFDCLLGHWHTPHPEVLGVCCSTTWSLLRTKHPYICTSSNTLLTMKHPYAC